MQLPHSTQPASPSVGRNPRRRELTLHRPRRGSPPKGGPPPPPVVVGARTLPQGKPCAGKPQVPALGPGQTPWRIRQLQPAHRPRSSGWPGPGQAAESGRLLDRVLHNHRGVTSDAAGGGGREAGAKGAAQQREGQRTPSCLHGPSGQLCPARGLEPPPPPVNSPHCIISLEGAGLVCHAKSFPASPDALSARSIPTPAEKKRCPFPGVARLAQPIAFGGLFCTDDGGRETPAAAGGGEGGVVVRKHQFRD